MQVGGAVGGAVGGGGGSPSKMSRDITALPATAGERIVLDRRVLQSLYLSEHEALRFAARSKAAGLLSDENFRAVQHMVVQSIERQVERRSAEAASELYGATQGGEPSSMERVQQQLQQPLAVACAALAVVVAAVAAFVMVRGVSPVSV